MTIREVLTSKMSTSGRQVRVRDKTKADKQIDITLVSDVPKGHINLFVRQSLRLVERYSIGLMYVPPVGEHSVLLRLNGPHGPNPHPGCAYKPHFHVPWPNDFDMKPMPTWKRGPKNALPLPEECGLLVGGWRYFVATIGLASDKRMDDAIRRMYFQVTEADSLFDP